MTGSDADALTVAGAATDFHRLAEHGAQNGDDIDRSRQAITCLETSFEDMNILNRARIVKSKPVEP